MTKISRWITLVQRLFGWLSQEANNPPPKQRINYYKHRRRRFVATLLKLSTSFILEFILKIG